MSHLAPGTALRRVLVPGRMLLPGGALVLRRVRVLCRALVPGRA